MLSRLSVSNFAVVEKAEALFCPGLNVLTGETGAGKSVLMGALDLVLGGRAESSVVRDGAKEAEVEAVFGDTLVRRTVTAEGRSRAWIGDESVSVAELREFGRRLVDIHGPRANQSLLEESFQRTALDALGGLGSRPEVVAYVAAWREWSSLGSELAALASESADEDELDLLRFQVGELEEANVTGDDDDLEARHAAAAHAADIVAAANDITEALGGDDGVTTLLAKLRPKFAAAARHFPAAEGWAASAESIACASEELSRTIADAASKLDTDPEALEELDRRLSLVNRIRRKYVDRHRDAATPEGASAPFSERIAAILAERKAKLDALEHLDERRAELAARLAAAEKAVRAAGAALTRLRKAAGAKLAKAVVAELRDLGFLRAEFSVALEPGAIEPHGCDRVIFMFGPNPGEAARPLAAIASSGEIARVMLALKAALASRPASDAAETLVFDEIDANVGGEIGAAVGAKMKALGRVHQVIAITHLPQSAVFGERHLVVAKAVSGGRTRTRICEVSGEARVSEIARMLGGEKITSVARKHAEELLKLSS